MVTRSAIGRVLVLGVLIASLAVIAHAAMLFKAANETKAASGSPLHPLAAAASNPAPADNVPVIRVVYPGPASTEPAPPKVAAQVPPEAPAAAPPAPQASPPPPATQPLPSSPPSPPLPSPASAALSPAAVPAQVPTAVPPAQVAAAATPPPLATAYASEPAVPEPAVANPASAPAVTPGPGAAAALDPEPTGASMTHRRGARQEPSPTKEARTTVARAVERSSGGGVNINRASVAELDRLDGGGHIGASIARHRPYASVEDLVKKRVLRRSVYEKIRSQIAAD